MKLFAALTGMLISLSMPFSASAQDRTPETIQIEDSNLTLNGAGFRSRFGIKVYEAALYLNEPTTDAESVLQANEPQMVRMDIRSGLVTKALIEEVIIQGFKSNRTYDTFRDEIAMLIDTFSETTGKGDYVDLYFEPGFGLRTYQNGEAKVAIESDVAFKAALYGIWLGDTPVQRRLKKYMLGVKKKKKKSA